MCTFMPPADKERFVFSFPWMLFTSFSCTITLSRTFSTMLIEVGESKHPWLSLDLAWNIQFLTFKYVSSRFFTSIPYYWEFFFKQEFVLYSVTCFFSISFEIIIWIIFLYSVYKMNFMDWFSNVKPTLNFGSWNFEPAWSWCIIIFKYCWILLANIHSLNVDFWVCINEGCWSLVFLWCHHLPFVSGYASFILKKFI